MCISTFKKYKLYKASTGMIKKTVMSHNVASACQT